MVGPAALKPIKDGRISGLTADPLPQNQHFNKTPGDCSAYRCLRSTVYGEATHLGVRILDVQVAYFANKSGFWLVSSSLKGAGSFHPLLERSGLIQKNQSEFWPHLWTTNAMPIRLWGCKAMPMKLQKLDPTHKHTLSCRPPCHPSQRREQQTSLPGTFITVQMRPSSFPAQEKWICNSV